MLSKEQEERLRERTLMVARYFLMHSDSTIDQVSAATHVPRATVHRYLNSESLKLEGEELSDVCNGNPYEVIQSLLRKLDEEEKRKKVLKVTKYILEHRNATIGQIAEATEVSKSSVQRYLNEDIVNELEGLGINNPLEIVKSILKNHKYEGSKKGGQHYASQNIPTQDEIGKFTGSTKKQ